MRKRRLFITLSVIAILVLLITASMGCVPKRNTPASTPDSTDIAPSTSKDAEQDSKISQLQAKIASQPDYSNEIARLEQEIESTQDELDNSQDNIDTALQNALDTIDAKIAEWEENQASSGTSGSNSSTSPEDVIEISITQPPTTYTVLELIADAEYTQTFSLTMSLENTLSIPIKDILIMAMAYPSIYPSATLKIIDVNITGGILFNRYSSNMFQSWGPLSLKAEQKKSYQLTVIVIIKNTGTETIPSSTLSVPIQAYCVDYSD